MPKSDWSDEDVERLRELWAAGVSLSAIGREIGGRTKHMVQGKAQRLGLPARPNPVPPVRPRVRPPEVHRAGRTTLPPLPSLGEGG
jgi:GcrA cell cycle regulator